MKTTYRLLALFLALVCLASLVSCGDKEEPLEENQIAVTWHQGAVTSEIRKENKLQLLDGEENYSYSDLIHLEKPGTKITFTDTNTEGMPDTEWAGYDVLVISHWVEEDGTYVLDSVGDNYTGTGGRSGLIIEFASDRATVTYTYVSSFADENIRLCYRSGQTAENTKGFCFAKVFKEETDELGTLLSGDAKFYSNYQVAHFLRDSKKEQWYDVLKGVTMFAMGDSYFGGSKNGKEYVWPNLLAQKYGMSFENYGIGGSTISNCPERNYYPMCDRIGAMSAGSPNIVLLEGGRNDSGKGVPLGTVDSNDPATFCGAINSCITQLQAKYPNALIIGITCWAEDAKRGNYMQEDFGNAMLDVCAARGLPCFNAMDKEDTKVDMDNASFRRSYCQQDANGGYTDTSHLNTAGMIRVEPAFERFIAAQYAAFLEK